MAVLSYNFFVNGSNNIVYFAIPNLNATSTDIFYSGNGGPFVAGDSKISQNGGALTNTANLVTQVSGKVYSLTLTNAELNLATNNQPSVVIISDADGPLFGDVCLNIFPALTVGQLSISQVSGNANAPVAIAAGATATSAISITNVVNATAPMLSAGGADVFGTIRVNLAQAGTASTITLDSGASATDNFYNECSITLTAGTGTGQARTIISYVGATKVATVNRAWTTNPTSTTSFLITRGGDVWDQLEGTQPSTGPIANNSTFRIIWQFLKRRFYNRVDQTPSQQTVFQDDSATTLTTMLCSATSTSQTKGKSS